MRSLLDRIRSISVNHPWLLVILGISLILNFWGIDAGLPERWYEDEVTDQAVSMAYNLNLVPSGFYYGALHYFQIIFVTVPVLILSKLLSFDPATRTTFIHLTSRGLSAVLGSGCVALTFFFGRQLFGKTSAIFAALFLTVSMGFVTSAHFARVDVPMCFWMMASLLASGRALTLGARSSYVIAGVFAGLAAGVKYVGGITILNLFLAYVLRGKTRDHSGLIFGILASAVSFILVNPAIWLASCSFIEGFVVDNAFNGGMGLEHEGSFLRLTLAIYEAVGGVLFVVMGLSSAYCLFLLRDRDHRTRVFFLFPLVLVYLRLLSNSNRPVIDYVLPILPILCVFVGKMISDVMTTQTKSIRWTGLVLAAITFIYSALFTIEANLRFTYDPRRLAAEWIDSNLPIDSTIEMTSYGPSNLRDRFKVVHRPHNNYVWTRVEKMEANLVYQSLMRWVRGYQSFAERLGLCNGEKPYYKAWFEKSRHRLNDQSEQFDWSLSGLEARNPDVLVVSSFYYDRFKVKGDFTSPEGLFFAGLFEGQSKYQRVAEFHTSILPWFDPKPEKINPTVIIFQPHDESRFNSEN